MAYNSATHTNPSFTNHSTPPITHVHCQTINCTITTSKNTTESVITTLSTTPTTISTTFRVSIEPVTSHNQHSIKESAGITTPMRRPPKLNIFPSRDFRLKCHKQYSSPFLQLQTTLTTAATSNFEQTTTTTKPPPKFKTSPSTSPQPTTTHSTSASGKHLPSEKDTTLTSTITITPTTINTTPTTRIPALMSINTSPHLDSTYHPDIPPP